MKKFLAILALTLLPTVTWAELPNPFHPYMPLGQIGFKSNLMLCKDSTKLSFSPDTFTGRYALPAALFTSGILNRDCVLDRRIKKTGSISSPTLAAANFTQYSPAAIMYALKLCGVEGRSDWPRMITADIFAELIQSGTVTLLKHTVRRERPDGNARNSFPSGHTATAFMCATLLHKEYGETVSPWISVAGYGLAVTTGLCRIEANRHFCSDVLAGAAIGIFSAELAYDMNTAIFGERGLKRAIVSPCQEEKTVWQFSLTSDFSLWSDSFTDCDIWPACSFGVKAAYMPWFLGAAVYAGATQIQWKGENDICIEDGASVPDILTAGAGIALDIPVMRRMDLTGHAIIGNTAKDCTYRFTDAGGSPTEWEFKASQRIMAGLGLSFRTTGFSTVSLTAGYDRYRNVWESFTLGTSFNLVF